MSSSLKRPFSWLQIKSKTFSALVLANFGICLLLLYVCEINRHGTFTQFRQSRWDLSQIGIKDYPVVENYEKKDWHDYEFMKYEATRQGPGEQGKGFQLTDAKDIELDKKLTEEEGLHVVVSDRISVNRSLWDTRSTE